MVKLFSIHSSASHNFDLTKFNSIFFLRACIFEIQKNNMKKLSLTVSFIALFITASFAQIENPAKWTYTAKKISDKL